MTKLRFVMKLAEADIRDPESVKRRFMPLMFALEALVQTDVWHLQEAIREGRPLPRLYDSGIRYQEEPPGQEDWLDYPTLLTERVGDCEDLACALTAERRVYDGIPSAPAIRWKFLDANYLRRRGYPSKSIPRDGLFLVHVLSQLPDGRIEDPSKVLGMRGSFS